MGDKRRFDLFAGKIAKHIGPDARIADVAGGKGYLQAALYERGYRHVTTWDKRRELARGRRRTKWGYFIWNKAPRDYDAVVGMHPDGATDHIIRYAAYRRVPFLVCPCCIVPSSDAFWGQYNFGAWVDHLVGLAERHQMQTVVDMLPMDGRNLVIVGTP